MRPIARIVTAFAILACLVAGMAPVVHFARPVRAAGPVYPLKVSANSRYLVDQTGMPFLLLGDSPHDLIAKVSESDAASYFATRQAQGLNAAAVYLLCGSGVGCNADGSTFDGLAPFLTAGDLSTPNPAYFARVDDMVRLAARYNVLVLLDPAETTDWLSTLDANGPTKDYAYGQYLGTRYKSFANVLWYNGNDFQTWNNSTDRAAVQAVARGIASTDRGALQTAELNYYGSDTWQDPSWHPPLVTVDGAYSYFPTYDEVLTGYNRGLGPVLLLEANYENGGQNGNVGTLNVLRRQEYWTMLSGAAGQLYGDFNVRHSDPGWQGFLMTPGVAQLGYQQALLSPLPWWNLVPDQAHTFLAAGYGTYTSTGLVKDSDYAAAARTPDGSVGLVYMPTTRTITVNMSRLAGQVTARWYDPSNGQYRAIGSFANAGSRQFTPPGNNSAGDGDWVLVLEVGGGTHGHKHGHRILDAHDQPQLHRDRD